MVFLDQTVSELFMPRVHFRSDRQQTTEFGGQRQKVDAIMAFHIKIKKQQTSVDTAWKTKPYKILVVFTKNS